MRAALLVAVTTGLTVRGLLPSVCTWLVFIPLALWLMRERSVWRGALASATAHLGLLFAAFEGALPAVPWTFPLAVAMALPWAALPGMLFVYCRPVDRSRPLPWLLPFVWTAAEFLAGRRWLWGSFASPVSLGYSQAEGPLFPLASLVGVYGLTFIVLLLNVAVAQVLVVRRPWPLLVPVLLVSFAARAVPAPPPASDSLIVAVAQPAIDPSWYEVAERLPEARRVLVDRLLSLSESALASADLVVWPEGAIPGGMDAPVLAAVDGVSADLLAGGITEREGRRFNSTFHFSDDVVSPVFDKLAPVPVGERGLSAGRRLVAGWWPRAWVAPLICLDSAYPLFSSRLARFGAQLIVVMSDDSFARALATPDLHLLVTRFRAIETGLPVIFASAAGPSSVISRSGVVVASIDEGESDVLVHEVELGSGGTSYVRFGDWLPSVAVAITLLACSMAFVFRR